LVIEDTGAGFSKEAREKVFVEPFYTDKQQHRGLGLLTTYGILHNCKGGLRIEHRPESGTQIHVLIPLASESASAAPRSLSPAASCGTDSKGCDGPSGPCHNPTKVLVVEDDPSMLQLMRKTLEGAGYQVCAATDGDQALASIDCATAPFNLVLSDVVMPRMSGFDLADQIQTRQPRVPVLLTSGKMSAGFVPNRFAGRQYTLLPKPFRPETLLNAVRSALARGSDMGSPASVGNVFEDKSRIPAEANSSSI
jgi:CheY-like chemotaxis protein